MHRSLAEVGIVLELSAIKVDPQKLDKGAWWVVRMEGGHLIGNQVEKPAEDDAALLVIPSGYSYERQLEREAEPHLTKLRRGDLDDADRDALMSKITGAAVAKKILRGWQNISFDGQTPPWSEDKAAEVLAKREWKILLDFVVAASGDRQATLAAQEAEAAGNS